MALAGDRLRHEVVDGLSYWSGPPAPARLPSPTVHLVRGYDEYVVAGGHWRRTSTRDTLLVEAVLYRALTPAESAALDAAAARQAAFVDLRPRVATSLLDGVS